MNKKNTSIFYLDGRFKIQDIMNGIKTVNKAFGNIASSVGNTKGMGTLKKTLTDLESGFTKLQEKASRGFTSEKEVQSFTKEYKRLQKVYADIAKSIEKIDLVPDDFVENNKELKKQKQNVEDLQKAYKKLQNQLQNDMKVSVISSKLGVQQNKVDEFVKGKDKKTNKDNVTAEGQARWDTFKKKRSGAIKYINDASSYDETLSRIQERRKQDKAAIGNVKGNQEMKQYIDAFYDEIVRMSKNALEQKAKELQIAETQFDMSKMQAFTKGMGELENIEGNFEGLGQDIRESENSLNSFMGSFTKMDQFSGAINNARNSLNRFLGASALLGQLTQAVRNAAREIYELDKQFNDISIVTGQTMDEMWDGFDKVNRVAQEYGVTTSNVVAVQTLYYHQGKSTAEVNKLTAETLTLAKISGLEYAEATDMMTAALNAFNIAAEDASQVTDVVSKLAAISASDTGEIMSALTRTASISANAGMDIESTSVFLTKMIETTRESAENLGTAMKTIVARFTELKENIDVDADGTIADFNRVDTALQAAGVSLKNTAGEFRDVDEVFMELSSVWDDLDRNTQRYIATQAAGSRQQSRFIAMIEDYDRTLELMNETQNSAGTGAEQLARSQESLETAVNKLKSSWQELYTNYLSTGIIKNLINVANAHLNWLNRGSTTLKLMTDALGLFILKQSASIVLTKIESLLIEKIGNKEEKRAFQQAQINKGKLKELAITKLIGQKTESFKKLWDQTNKDAGIFERLKAVFSNSKTFGGEGSKAIKNIPEGSLTKRTPTGGKGIGTAISGAGNAVTSAALSNPIATAAVVAVGAITAAIASKFIGDFLEVKKIAENTDKTIKELTDASSKYTDTLSKYKEVKSLLKTYKELQETTARTTEQDEELIQTQNSLAEKMPELVKYYDAEGNAVLKTTENLNELIKIRQEEVDKTREAYELQKRKGAQYGIFDSTTSTGISFQRAKDTASGLDAGAYSSYATWYNALSQKEIKEGLENFSEAKGFNAYSFGQLTGDTITGDQFRKIQYSIENQLRGGNIADLNQGELNSLFREALKESNEYLGADREKINYLLQLNEDMGNTLISTFANMGDYIKEIRIQEANLNIQNAAEDAGIAEQTGVIESLQKISENNLKNGQNSYEGAITSSLGSGSRKIYDRSEQTWEQIGAGVATSLVAAGVTAVLTSGNPVATVGMTGLGFKAGWDMQPLTDEEVYTVEEMTDIVNTYIDSAENAEEAANNLKNADKQAYEALESYLNDTVDGQTVADYFEEVKDIPEKYAEQQQEFIEEFARLNSVTQDVINDNLAKYSAGEINAEDLETNIESVLEQQGIRKGSPVYDYLLGNDEREDLYFTIVSELETTTAAEIEEYLEKIQNLVDNNIITIPAVFGEGFKLMNLNTEYGLTPDQINQLYNGIANVNAEYGSDAAQGYFDYLSELMVDLGKGDSSKLISLTDQLFGVDSISGLNSIREELKSIGLTTEEIDGIWQKAGLAGSLAFVDTNDAAEKLITTLDKLTNASELLNEALAGTLDFKGLKDLLTTYKDLKVSDFVATAEGYRLQNTENANYEELAKLEFGGYANETRSAMAQSTVDFLMSQGNAYEDALKLYEKTMGEADKYSAMSAEEQEKYLDDKYTDETTRKLAESYLNDYAKQNEALELNELAYQQAILDYRVKAAKQELDSWKNIISLLESFDKWFNYDQMQEVLDLDKGIFQSTFELAINSTISEQALSDSLNNTNQQIALARARQQEALAGTESWKKTIQNDYSKYLQVDTEGNLIKTKGYTDLYDQAANKNLSEAEREALQAQIETIDGVAEAYINNYKNAKDYKKKEIELLKEVKEQIKETYEVAGELEDSYLKILQENDNKELENFKSTIDKKKEALDDYLSAVQDSIDQERKMRELADQEEDLRQKERKLSILQMDTSGLYAGDIASLQNEIATDRQSLEDAHTDQYVSNLELEIQKQQESYDADIVAWEEYLNWKKETMTLYNEEISALMAMSTEEQVAWYQVNSQEYQTMTSSNKEAARLAFEDTVTNGVAAYNIVKTEGLDPYIEALKAMSDETIPTVDEATKTYADNALVKFGDEESGLIGAAQTLNEKLSAQAKTLEDKLVNAWGSAEKAAIQYAAKLDELGINYTLNPEVNTEELKDTSVGTLYSTGKIGSTSFAKYTIGENGVAYKQTTSLGLVDFWERQDEGFKMEHIQKSGGEVYASADGENWINLANNGVAHKNAEEVLDRLDAPYVYWDEKLKRYVPKFAKGGYVDYTGPAWVDGTPTKPEAFLSAADTARFEELKVALQGYKGISRELNNEPSQVTYEININVDELGEDYTVADLREEIENEIYKISTQNKITKVKR